MTECITASHRAGALGEDMMRAGLLAAAVVAGLSGQAGAQMATGNDLLEGCNGSSGEHQGFCFGFIAGVTEGIRLGIGYPLMVSGERSAAEISKLSDSLLNYCALNEVTAAQNVMVVKKYLTENPQLLHYPARGLILQAYQGAYAC